MALAGVGVVNQNTLNHSVWPPLSCWELPGWYPRWGWWTRAQMKGSVRDLYRHGQQFYSTIVSHTANCCGREKLNCTVSQSSCTVGQWPLCAALFITLCCTSNITTNISHPPCCQLAQVVPLSSPPFNVKLSVWLPSNCNAAPLITKATTQLKEVAFLQPITHYQILCCYRVSRLGLLNEQQLRELEWGGKCCGLW